MSWEQLLTFWDSGWQERLVMEENPNSKFAYKLYWGHMKKNEHTVTVQRLMFTLFFFNFVTDFYCFPTTYCSNLAMFLCMKHIPIVKIILHCKLHYILLWNILIVSFMYLELNWNMSAVSIFSIIDTVCFMTNIIT